MNVANVDGPVVVCLARDHQCPSPKESVPHLENEGKHQATTQEELRHIQHLVVT